MSLAAGPGERAFGAPSAGSPAADERRAYHERTPMSSYRFPELAPITPAPPRTVYIVASGDLRPSANVNVLARRSSSSKPTSPRAVESLGWTVVRGHPFDAGAGHGFIDSQREGHRGVRARSRPTRR